jgi:hypothetical protein
VGHPPYPELRRGDDGHKKKICQTL